jgi:NAD(P)-dependent dehydrogenase (short-subunit alcohol dehydrogenase family)
VRHSFELGVRQGTVKLECSAAICTRRRQLDDAADKTRSRSPGRPRPARSATMTERVKKLVAGNAALTRLADSHLLGLIEPDDIASMALNLASDESRMVTGQVLPVDSGVTIS